MTSTNRKILSFILSSTLFLISSCGYFNDEREPGYETFENKEFANECEIDPDKFEEIFESNIEEQLNCLHINFDQFTKYVKRGNDQVVSQNDLGEFIKQFFSDQSEMILNSMQIIFELNQLVLKEKADQVTPENIKNLFKLLISSNKYISELTLLSKGLTPQNYLKTRPLIEKSLNSYVSSIKEIMSLNTQKESTKIQLDHFLNKINSNFSQINFSQQDIQTVLGLKKIFIGGHSHIVTTEEILTLLDTSEDIVLWLFDLLYSEGFELKNQIKRYSFYQNLVKTLRSKIIKRPPHETLLPMQDLMNLLEHFFSDSGLEGIKKLTYSLKLDILKGDIDTINYGEMDFIFDLTDIIFDTFIYNEKRKELLQDSQVTREQFEEKLKDESQKLVSKIISNIEEWRARDLNFSMNTLKFFTALPEYLPELSLNTRLIRLLHGLKKLIVGGDRNIVNLNEFYHLANKVDTIVEIYADILFLNQNKDNSDYLDNVLNLFTKAKSIVYKDALFETAFSVDDLQDFIEFNDRNGSLVKFFNIITAIKRGKLKSSHHLFTYKEILEFLDMGTIIVKSSQLTQDISSQIEVYRSHQIYPQDYPRSEEFEITLSKIKSTLKGINFFTNEYDLVPLLKELSKSFFGDKNEFQSLIKLLSKIVFGENFNHITQSDWHSFIDRLDQFIAPYWQMKKVLWSFEKNTLKETMEIIPQLIQSFQDVIPHNHFSLELIKTSELKDIFDYFYPSPELKDQENQKEKIWSLFLSMKKNILSGDPDSLSLFDLHHLLQISEVSTYLYLLIESFNKDDLSLNSHQLYQQKSPLFDKLKKSLSHLIKLGEDSPYFLNYQFESLIHDVLSFYPQPKNTLFNSQSLNFFKKLFLGGNSHYLTHKEISHLYDHFSLYENFILQAFSQYSNSDSQLSYLQNILNNYLHLLKTVPLSDFDITLNEIEDLYSYFQENFITDESPPLSQTKKLAPLLQSFLKIQNNRLNKNQIQRIIQSAQILSEFFVLKNQLDLRLEDYSLNEWTVPLYEEIKNDSLEKILIFSQKQLEILRNQNIIHSRINLDDLLSKFIDFFQINLNIPHEDFLTLVKELKSFFFSGDNSEISSKNLDEFIQSIPLISSLYFDLQILPQLEKKNPLSPYIALKMVADLDSLLRDPELFTPLAKLNIKSIENFLKILGVKGQSTLQMILESFIHLKTPFLGGLASEFNLTDLSILLEYSQDLFKKLFVLITVFNQNQETILSPDFDHKFKLDIELLLKDLPYLPQMMSTSQLKDATQFVENIFNHQKFFIDQNSRIHFDYNPPLNFYGVVLSGTLQWGIELLVRCFGDNLSFSRYLSLSLEERPPLIGLNLKQVNKALDSFAPLLKYFNMWTAKIETFARNTLLLGDLFQNSSNGNMKLDARELTEYGNLVLSSVALGNEFFNKLDDYCTPVEDNQKVYAPNEKLFSIECIRNHFYTILFDDLKLNEFLPQLSHYLKSISDRQKNSLLVFIEKFARDYPKVEATPKKDIIFMIGSFFNVESTVLRYDLNKNNQIDHSELMKSFEVYKESIITLAGFDKDIEDEDDREDAEEDAKLAFIYMIKFEKIPTSSEFVKFKYNPFGDKKAVAKRKNIAGLLSFIVSQ